MGRVCKRKILIQKDVEPFKNLLKNLDFDLSSLETPHWPDPFTPLYKIFVCAYIEIASYESHLSMHQVI